MEISRATETEVVVQDSSVEHVIDLTKCINCDNCTIACKERHGFNRLNRQEVKERSQGEIIPYTCRQCFERHCVKICPLNAIRIDEASGIVSVGSQCIGCGFCAEICPYKAIKICERTKVVRLRKEDSKGKGILQLFRKEKEVVSEKCAVKCDLCIGYENFACVYECPTGALKVRVIRKDGTYKELNSEKECPNSNDHYIENEGANQKGNYQMPNIERGLPYCQEDTCIKCRICSKKCPVEAINMEPYPKFDYEKCVKCYVCQKVCPKKVILISEGIKDEIEKEERIQEEVIVKEDSKNPLNVNQENTEVDNIKASNIVMNERQGANVEIKLVIDSSMTPENLLSLIKVLKTELNLKA